MLKSLAASEAWLRTHPGDFIKQADIVGIVGMQHMLHFYLIYLFNWLYN